MIRAQTTREKIFKDFHFYKSKPDTHKIRQHQFEKSRGQYEKNTFRKKKQSTFANHTYSSNLNPLSRGNGRYDKPYKLTYERRKMVPYHSFIKTDPVSLAYEQMPHTPTMRNYQQNHFGSSFENQQKYELPARRVISPAHKQYYHQDGFSRSLQSSVRSRDKINASLLMKSTIQYTQANHIMQQLTGKIGHYHY